MKEDKQDSWKKIDDLNTVEFDTSKRSSNDSELDELKQTAGQFAKAAGSMVGSLCKYALKKGGEIVEKLEDEEFQEKTKQTINSFAEKATDEATKVVKKATNLKEERDEERFNNKKKQVQKRNDAIEERKKKKHNPSSEKKISRREAKRLKKEKEERQSLIIGLALMVIPMIFLLIMGGIEDKKEESVILMPSLKGMTVEEVLVALEEHEIDSNNVVFLDADNNGAEIENPKSKWIVSKQNPKADTEIGDETEIRLTIYNKKMRENQEKDKTALEAFVGTTCYESDKKILELGYTPTYLAENTMSDMTGDIQYFEETAKTFTIIELSTFSFKEKTVTYIVQSEWMKEQEEKNSAATTSMKDYEAISAVVQYGKEYYNSFELKQVLTTAEVQNGKWVVLGPCTYKNVYGTKEKAECLATVSGTSDHRVVEAFEIR